MVIQPAERVFDGPFHFVSRTRNGCVKIRGFVLHREGRKPFQAHLHQAPFIRGSSFAGVLIAQVDFHASDTFHQMAESTLHHGIQVLLQPRTAFDVVVRIDLYPHKSRPFSYPWAGLRRFRGT
jgi:hypothetical protein